MDYERIDYNIDGKWKTCCYNDLNKDCKNAVDDLINSSLVCQRWDDNLKRRYYTKIVAIACESGKSKSLFGKLIDKLIRTFDELVYKITSKIF